MQIIGDTQRDFKQKEKTFAFESIFEHLKMRQFHHPAVILQVSKPLKEEAQLQTRHIWRTPNDIFSLFTFTDPKLYLTAA